MPLNPFAQSFVPTTLRATEPITIGSPGTSKPIEIARPKQTIHAFANTTFQAKSPFQEETHDRATPTELSNTPGGGDLSFEEVFADRNALSRSSSVS